MSSSSGNDDKWNRLNRKSVEMASKRNSTGSDDPPRLKLLFRFIYELCYPAILGSMLYQVIFDASSSAQSEYHHFHFQQILVVVVFILDWCYTRNIKEIKGETFTLVEKMVIGWVDLASAILFLVAFAFLGNENPSMGAATIGSIAVVYWVLHLWMYRFQLELVVLTVILGLCLTGLFYGFRSMAATVFLVVVVFLYSIVAIHRIWDVFGEDVAAALAQLGKPEKEIVWVLGRAIGIALVSSFVFVAILMVLSPNVVEA